MLTFKTIQPHSIPPQRPQAQPTMRPWPRRGLQTAMHPARFARRLRLSDNSTVTVASLAPPPPGTALPFSVTRLSLDSANHPSWNAALSDRLLLNERGQVARFRQRFTPHGPSADALQFAHFADLDPSLQAVDAGPTGTPKENVKGKGKGKASGSKK